jgi:hypothetical protein
MPASQKIITKLRERRQIEANLRSMLTARSDAEFRRQAQRIAALGTEVIPAIVSQLDTADSRMLVVLGTVSTYLDHGQITKALRRAVQQPHRTDEGRVSAMTILERFLGEPPDEQLLSNLKNPESVAASSLEKVLAEAVDNPAVLIEYVQSLDQQEPDLVLSVARALRNLSAQSPDSQQASRVIEPLRMMAQDVRSEISAAAIQALGTIRLQDSVRALQSLVTIIDPNLGPLAQRSIRKLGFSGIQVDELPPPQPQWRALISPVDGVGRQSAWFILAGDRTPDCRFLNILLSDWAGAIEAAGYDQVPARMLPPQQPIGHVHDIVLPSGAGAMLMLEIPFDRGRWHVRNALARNRETQIPIAGSLRLLSPWLWEVSGPVPMQRALPEPLKHDESLFAESNRLLSHPAFAPWTTEHTSTMQVAEQALRHPNWDREVWIRRLAGELFSEPSVIEAFHRRLVTMSEWLLLAGEEAQARMALLVAERLLESDPRQQPFILALVRRDLELAVKSLAQ